MKPTHRIFCPACGHSKMHFETEKEALAFLEYNGNDILEETGKRPIRAYYCDVCIAWHLTSMEHFYTDSSYEVLKNRYKNEPDISALKAQVPDIQGIYNRGLYQLAVERALSVIKPIVTKHIYVEQSIKDIINPCYDVIDKCLPLLFAKIDQSRKNDTITEEELKQKILSINTLIQKLQTKKDVRLNQMYKKYATRFKKFKQTTSNVEIQQHNQAQSQFSSPEIKRLKNTIKQADKLYTTQQYAKCFSKSADALKQLATCIDNDLDTPKTQIYSKLYSQLVDSAMCCFYAIDSLIQEQKWDKARYENTSLLEQLSYAFDNYKCDENLNKLADACKRLVQNRYNRIFEEEYKNISATS